MKVKYVIPLQSVVDLSEDEDLLITSISTDDNRDDPTDEWADTKREVDFGNTSTGGGSIWDNEW